MNSPLGRGHENIYKKRTGRNGYKPTRKYNMKYIEETHKELRNKAAAAFWDSRHYSQEARDFLAFGARCKYSAYATAAQNLQKAMFRDRCRAKGVEV